MELASIGITILLALFVSWYLFKPFFEPAKEETTGTADVLVRLQVTAAEQSSIPVRIPEPESGRGRPRSQ